MQQTESGYYIIQPGDLDIKSNRHEGQVRSTCPVCRDQRTHGQQACMSINLDTGFGQCFKCGAKFVLQEHYERYLLNHQYDKTLNREKTMKPKDDTPSRGAVLRKEESAAAEPGGAAKGDTTAGTSKTVTPMQESGDRAKRDGGGGLHSEPTPHATQRRTFRTPDVSGLADTLNGTLVDYLLRRGIDPKVALRAGVRGAKRSFGGLERDCLAFCYNEAGRTVNVQYKTTDKQFQLESGCELIPWNVDACLGRDEVFITEGMMDALALMQCGIDNVVSVPNGANSVLPKAFDRFMESHFRPLTTIYIAGDTDEEGLKLRAALCRYFGEARCKLVEWAGCKDANELLMVQGEAAVRKCVGQAADCPIRNVTTVGSLADRLQALFENGIPEGRMIGLLGFDHLVKFELGRFCVISGYPGAGKSSFADFLMMRLALREGWKAAVFSPEKYPTELHCVELLQMLCGRRFLKSEMTDELKAKAVDWLSRQVYHIDCECGTTIEAILDSARQVIRRYGIRQLLLDPFNYIELPTIAGANDTQKISEVLKAIVAFAHEENVLVMLVAHPKKPDEQDKKGRASLYDIAGSADFYNKCDYGIILRRDKELKLTFVNVLKIRFQHLGRIGYCALRFDRETGRYAGCHERQGDNAKGEKVTTYEPETADKVSWV